MNGDDQELRDVVRRSWPDAGGPSFIDTWTAATRRRSAGRRNRAYGAVAAAVVMAAAIALFSQAPERARYIEADSLLETTYWIAPSDSLLPDRQFDIYQDVPAIFESMEPAGGSLL